MRVLHRYGTTFLHTQRRSCRLDLEAMCTKKADGASFYLLIMSKSCLLQKLISKTSWSAAALELVLQ